MNITTGVNIGGGARSMDNQPYCVLHKIHTKLMHFAYM